MKDEEQPQWWLDPREAFRVYPREVLTAEQRGKLRAWARLMEARSCDLAEDKPGVLSMDELARCRFHAWRTHRNGEHRHRVVKS